jgi:hypothetical protein
MADFEPKMQDLQEHTSGPCPLFIKENYHKEISRLGPIEDQEKNSPICLVYDDYDSDPWESQEEEEEEEGRQFISCLEPINEKPSPEISQPATSYHPPVLTRDI